MVLSGFLAFALLAAVFWAFANVLDKAVLQDYITNPVVVTFFTGVFGCLFALILPLTGYVNVPSAFVLVISLILGVLYVFPTYLYMRSLTMEEVSRAVPIFSISPVFVVVMGALFLSEVFTFSKYVGIFLTIIGSVMISSKEFGKEFFHLKANKAFWMMFLGTFFFALYAVAVRWILNFEGFWNVFFWSRVGSAIPILFLLLHTPTRTEIVQTVSKVKETRLEFMALSEFLNNLAVLTQTVALSLGPAALVETATSAQSLFVLIFVGVLKHVWDRDLGDDLSRKAVLIKAISVVLIIVGIYLIR